MPPAAHLAEIISHGMRPIALAACARAALPRRETLEARAVFYRRIKYSQISAFQYQAFSILSCLVIKRSTNAIGYSRRPYLAYSRARGGSMYGLMPHDWGGHCKWLADMLAA